MGLLRTILSLVMLLILVHVVLVYLGVEQTTNTVTNAIYSLGALLEAPGALILGFLGDFGPDFLDPNSFYAVALTALAAYFLVYVLLGASRD
ncbi:Hypothetical Protein RradSPS_0897 [Rubrobacter radiotolerans]|uniref:Uncharacterized protein n=1 Tax=Rubrobacter radiotolerans TaxID=42256 RepID=A0A023X2F8_RUBRA|nr:hypothetical protein [Rubrobacter radiotolerans]AHY46180.1 Hypothetical Protein RradSPS_0897 [Rubrobacter radiotolerans]MDX5893590.1 hypothetical protein [Rubrobacter radiotolerans]SMC04065.1 conserved hypothetical protein [Rubrobacter radiotolerans DSM 5868]